MANHLSPRDVVPPIREDLEASPPPSGTGAEVITVAPHDGRSGAMRMHGFEFSIARMLDGRRTADDVIANCQRLGLPVNLDALEDFLFQLKTHGLLSAVPVQGRKAGFNWAPEVRDLYRNALRAAREGEFARAKQYLDTLLNRAPGTIEAVRLRDWIDTHPDPHVAGRTFGAVFQRTLDSWAEERPPHWTAEVRDTLRKTSWPIVGVLTAIAFLIAYAFLPTSHRVTASAVLAPGTEVPIAAPVTGTVDEVFVKEGDQVEAGAPLFAYGVGELQARLSELSDRLEAARAPLRAEAAKTPEGAPLAEALARAEDELTRAQSDLLLEQKETAGAPPREAGSGAEQRYAAANQAVQTAREQLDARIPGDAAGDAAAMAAEVKALTEQIQAQTVKAPSAGVVSKLYVRPGQALNEGQAAAQLTDSKAMKLTATLSPKYIKELFVGTPITVKIGDEHYATKVEAVSGNEVAAELQNQSGSLKPGNVKVLIDVPPSAAVPRPKP